MTDHEILEPRPVGTAAGTGIGAAFQKRPGDPTKSFGGGQAPAARNGVVGQVVLFSIMRVLQGAADPRRSQTTLCNFLLVRPALVSANLITIGVEDEEANG